MMTTGPRRMTSAAVHPPARRGAADCSVLPGMASASLRAPTLPAKRANACRLRAVTDSSRPLAHVPAHLAGRHAQRHRVAVRGVGIGGKELSDLPSTDWSP
ncbi:unnamed protein product, partial [Prorocentrum cordatum]